MDRGVRIKTENGMNEKKVIIKSDSQGRASP